jgi:tetratricopeptide (TPR) repeat protein
VTSTSLPTATSRFPRTEAAGVFVGREAEIEALRDAFGTACAGRAVTVRVSGAAGMGKSTLVQHFVDGLTTCGEAMVLRGRAYERESVPYKAVDSVVDALSRHLMRLEDSGDAIALPEDVWALARLFPVLRRVPVVAGAVAPPVIDPQGIRLRAFAALRELMTTLRCRKPVVVYIDDVHWGDTDSAGLLMDLMRADEAPPILLIMTHRQSDNEASPFVTEITKHWPEAADAREIILCPLEPDAAQRLALRLIESAGAPSEHAARAIAREGGGSPFLIEELARHCGRAAADNTRTFFVPTLQQMVAERVERLGDDPRRILEILAVAGRPLTVPVLADASGVYAAADELVVTLTAQRFVRNGLRGGQEVVDIVHDRIRETVVAALSGERLREHHGRLACVLQTTPSPDPEAIATHLLGAGDPQHLPRFAERAAEDATDKLAFEQAARLFRLILKNVPAASRNARRLRARLAQVLEWSGHGAEAARVYLEAAEGAKGMQRVELERAAAEQLLTSGRLDEGREVLLRVLTAVGMTAPHTPIAAALWILFYRLRMALFGVRFGDRDQEEIRPVDRMCVDALYAVSIGFAIVDVVLGACMQARHLVLALRLGDRLQGLRAAITMTTQLANRGGPPGKHERALLENVRRALERTDSAEAHAYAAGNHGVALFLRGRWKEAAQASDAAYARYPNIRGGWHSNAKLFAVYALAYTGDVPELARRYKHLLAEATRRGDLYTAVNLRTSIAKVVHLAADDPEKARSDVREGVAQWSKLGYLVQHWQALRSEVDIDIYAGHGASAHDRVQRDARPLRRSFLLQSQFVRVMTLDLRGRAAIASIEQCPSFREARLKEARRMGRRLELERMPYADALASLLAGAVANAAHDRVAATAALRRAVDRLEAVHMAHFAASARHRLGQLLGDDGRALVHDAEEALAVRGVREIDRFSAVYVPGRWQS